MFETFIQYGVKKVTSFDIFCIKYVSYYFFFKHLTVLMFLTYKLGFQVKK